MKSATHIVLREPLFQFLVIGALLFGAEYLFTVNRDDPRQIFIGQEQISRLVQVFYEGQGRLPNDEEIDNLITKWSQNELFYREAQAMGLDQGDDMMRSRLVLKMRNVLLNRVMSTTPDDDELEQWFELNRSRYDIPELYSIEQVRVEQSEDAHAIAAELGTGALPAVKQPTSRRYSRRSAENLSALFDDAGKDALLQASAKQWLAVQSAKGWHLARVTEIHPAVPATFGLVKTRVVKDFRKAASGLQVADMAAEIADKYTIHLEFDEQDIDEALADVGGIETEQISARSRTLKARAGVSRSDEESPVKTEIN